MVSGGWEKTSTARAFSAIKTLGEGEMYAENNMETYITICKIGQCSSLQLLSPVWLYDTPWTAACQASLSITNSWSFLKLSPLSQWDHPTISSSVVPFSSCLQSFPASGSFPMSQLFASGGQSTGASAPASVLPMNIQDWLVWFPCSPRDSQESSPTPQFKSINFSALFSL